MLQTLEGEKEPGQGKPRELEQRGLHTASLGCGVADLCPSPSRFLLACHLLPPPTQPHRALLALAAL